jgi:thioredoxin 1
MSTELSDADFAGKTNKGNVIIDFYADWCGPCQIMKPVFDKVSKDFKKVNFYKVNVDESSEAASTYEVRSIPTIVFLKDGEEVDRFMGAVHEEDFKDKIKKIFK